MKKDFPLNEQTKDPVEIIKHNAIAMHEMSSRFGEISKHANNIAALIEGHKTLVEKMDGFKEALTRIEKALPALDKSQEWEKTDTNFTRIKGDLNLLSKNLKVIWEDLKRFIMQEQVKTTDEAVADLKNFISAENKKSNDQNVSDIKEEVVETLNQFWKSNNERIKKVQNELFTPTTNNIELLKKDNLILYDQMKKINRIQYALHIANLIILATLIFYVFHGSATSTSVSSPTQSKFNAGDLTNTGQPQETPKPVEDSNQPQKKKNKK